MIHISDDSRDLYHSALTDYRENRHAEAETKLKQVLAAAPQFEDAYEALSVLLYNLKRYDESMEVLRAWIKLNPDSIMSHTNLSRCYVAKEMILEAEHEQAEARRLTWKAELKSKKLEMPKIDYTAQIERFKQVIAYDPADVLGYFSLGQVYLEAGHSRDAAEIFEKGVAADPKHSASYLGWGQALTALGDRVKAEKVYAAGIKVAEEKGDMMTQRKMESLLRKLVPPDI